MPRPRRTAPGGLVYHVLNRANARRQIFHRDGDYLAFEQTLAEVQDRVAMRILAWCLMPNHWHLVLWPREDGDLSDYVRLVTLTHTQRWHACRASAGTGHLYQGHACNGGREDAPLAHAWPVARPPDWPERVNEAEPSSELETLRSCARRGTPYGENRWAEHIAERLGLKCTLRARGRPRKDPLSEKGS